MGIKSFVLRNILKAKGVPKEQLDVLVSQFEKNPEMLNQLKKLQDNPELMSIFKSIQDEVDKKVKQGMDQMMATSLIMKENAHRLEKTQEDLIPLMSLFKLMQDK